MQEPSNDDQGKPPITHEVTIRRDAAGGLHVQHPEDVLVAYGMLEMAKVAILEGRFAARAKAAAQEPRIVPAAVMPAGLPRLQ